MKDGLLLHAVDDVSFDLGKGQTLGVVGESGCGKTTLGRTVLRLVPATGGEVYFDKQPVNQSSKKELKALRQRMQIIFQDPYESLNPRMSVGELISEPIIVNRSLKRKDAILQRTHELMDRVGLAKRLINSYPHELDGGRRQRIGIARALSVNPEFIVCDEPVSALDVSIQAQILNLMQDLQEELNLTYMFITHNLSVVRHISDEIIVMYLGQVVERARTEDLFVEPLHPYTKALLSAVPIPSTSSKGKKRVIIEGEVASPIAPKDECRFAPRCPHVVEKCYQSCPQLQEAMPGRFVACIKVNV